jgi:hypothetical protein
MSCHDVTVITNEKGSLIISETSEFQYNITRIYKGCKISKHWNFCEHHYRGLYCYRKVLFSLKACQDYLLSQWSRKIYLLLIHYIALSQ